MFLPDGLICVTEKRKGLRLMIGKFEKKLNLEQISILILPRSDRMYISFCHFLRIMLKLITSNRTFLVHDLIDN